MKAIRLAAAAAAVFFLAETARPEPVQAGIVPQISCVMVCSAIGGACSMIAKEMTDKCLVMVHGCIDGCNLA